MGAHQHGSPPADVLAAAVALDLAVDDMRVQLRATRTCLCPDAGGLCRDDCAHCAGLPDAEPCPNDPAPLMPDAAHWSPPQEDLSPAALELGSATANPPVAAPVVFEPASNTGPRPVSPAAHWAPAHDERSRAFALAPRLAGTVALADVLLADGPALDQGKEGQCVGFGVADAGNALTLAAGLGRPLLNAEDAHQLYEAARKIDGERQSDPDGTSVLAGMKAGQAAGLWPGYLWAFGTRDIAQAVMHRRPVVIGVPWWSAMYDTGPGGLVVGVGGGQLVGGHCLAIVGLRLRGPQGQSGPYFVWRNSWGPGYGDGGNGYIHHRDLAALLHRQGEAAIPQLTAP